MSAHRLLSLTFRLMLVLLAFWTIPVLAQPPSESCDGTQELGAADMLPQSHMITTPVTNDMDMSGAGCAASESDVVICFTPELSCTLNIDCVHTGADVAVNLFDGVCTDSPSSCLASDSGTGIASIVAGLTGGTHYCIVCETDLGSGTMFLDFDVDSGSCGALPVELQSFSMTSSADADNDSKSAESEG